MTNLDEWGWDRDKRCCWNCSYLDTPYDEEKDDYFHKCDVSNLEITEHVGNITPCPSYKNSWADRKEIPERMMYKEIILTDDMICPYCGKAQSDPMEIIGTAECGTTECGHCDKIFQWSMTLITKYTTKPIK